MIEPTLLQRAVARGILSEVQALDLARLDLESAPEKDLGDPPRDDEQLRFVTGFADIFVTIGLVLFLGTLSTIAGDFGGAALAGAAVAVAAWGLAEFFTRRRRMALPSIVLLLAFALGSGSALTSIFVGYSSAIGWASVLDVVAPNFDRPLPMAAAALATLALVALHYRRFRVPITVAAGTAALFGAMICMVVAAVPELALAHLDALLIAAGVAIFAIAMRFDLADPNRLTLTTDIAFWLHLLAAPLIVHPVLSALALSRADGISSGTALMVLGVVLLLAVVALVTDRRAILVAGLAYTAIAFGTLIRDAGFANRSVPLSLLALGAFVLLLSAGWHPLRGWLLRALPRDLAARLPHSLALSPGAR